MDCFGCHHCGYDLSGLGETGRCPECGNVFDVSFKLGAPPRENLLTRYAGAIMLAVVTLSILVCGGLLSLGAREPLGIFLAVLTVAGVFAFGTFVYWWTAYKAYKEETEAQREAYERSLKSRPGQQRGGEQG